MTKEELIDLLNADLSNELKHMMFYLHHSVMVQGLHREEIGELLSEAAESELKHVQEFARVIVGLGGEPTTKVAYFNWGLTCPKEILQEALRMEDEVVKNYVGRMEDALTVGGVDGKYVEIFLEDQILDSRGDADNIREMLKGM